MRHSREPPILPWTELGTETLSEHSIFNLTRTERRSPTSGRTHHYLRLEAPDWVNVVAFTADGEMLLVEQYRHGTDAVTLEIPGGAVDPGETPAAAAVRELEEETGFRVGRCVEIGRVDPNPAFQTNACWTFVAFDCTPDGHAQPDPSEEIAVRRIPLERFTALIDDGTIRHALVIAAHDHLMRGLRRSAPWANAVQAPE